MQDLGSSELRKDIYITVHIIRIGRYNILFVRHTAVNKRKLLGDSFWVCYNIIYFWTNFWKRKCLFCVWKITWISQHCFMLFIKYTAEFWCSILCYYPKTKWKCQRWTVLRWWSCHGESILVLKCNFKHPLNIEKLVWTLNLPHLYTVSDVYLILFRLILSSPWLL